MAEFNIQSSQIEQLNSDGNNYKISGSGANVISENGDVSQVHGDNNRVRVAERKSGFIGWARRQIATLWAWIIGG